RSPARRPGAALERRPLGLGPAARAGPPARRDDLTGAARRAVVARRARGWAGRNLGGPAAERHVDGPLGAAANDGQGDLGTRLPGRDGVLQRFVGRDLLAVELGDHVAAGHVRLAVDRLRAGGAV